MKGSLVCAVLVAVVATAGAQTFVPRIGNIPHAGDGTWSRGTSDEMTESARKLAESQTFDLPKGTLEPQGGAGESVPDPSEIPADSSALPLVPILGGVLGVAAIGVAAVLGTKSRWARSRA